jgi:hypothetical protein
VRGLGRFCQLTTSQGGDVKPRTIAFPTANVVAHVHNTGARTCLELEVIGTRGAGGPAAIRSLGGDEREGRALRALCSTLTQRLNWRGRR